MLGIFNFYVMEELNALEELNQAVNKVVEASNKVNEEANAEVWSKAPVIVHQRFCNELVRIMKKKPKSTPKDIPEAMDVLTAIRVLEGLYPELSKK